MKQRREHNMWQTCCRCFISAIVSKSIHQYHILYFGPTSIPKSLNHLHILYHNLSPYSMRHNSTLLPLHGNYSRPCHRAAMSLASPRVRRGNLYGLPLVGVYLVVHCYLVPLWSYHWAFDGWTIYSDGSSTFSVCVSSELLQDGREGRTPMAWHFPVW